VQIVAPIREGVGRFAFAHALTQQTLYEELGSALRMRLHWRVGEALERRHARALAAHASAIAHHFAEGVLAGDPLRSADASLRAAEQAAVLAGHEEAKDHFERALATLDQAGLEEPERRYQACMGLGQALRCLGEMVAHYEPFLEAVRIAQTQRWVDRVAEAAFAATWHLPTDPVLLRRLLVPVEAALEALGPRVTPERAALLSHRAWLAHFANADYDRMEAGFEEAAAIADQCGDASVAVRVRHVPIFLLHGSPDVDEYERRSKQYLEAALEIRYASWACGGGLRHGRVRPRRPRGGRASAGGVPGEVGARGRAQWISAAPQLARGSGERRGTIRTGGREDCGGARQLARRPHLLAALARAGDVRALRAGSAR
jgi:hypothetical protein